MKKKIIMLTVLLLVAWACAGPHYFDLYIKPNKNETTVKINKILQVKDIRTNEAFWHQRMVYRQSAYKVRFFSFEQWVKRPGELIKDTIIQYYKNSSLFTQVIGEDSAIEADIVMRIIIDSLEMFYEEKQWYAHLALDIEFVDVKSEKTFLTHSFDRRMRIKGKKPKYVPEKISMILQEELMKIFEKLKHHKPAGK